MALFRLGLTGMGGAPTPSRTGMGKSLATTGAVLALTGATPAFAQFGGPIGPCEKEDLQAVTDSYIAGLREGDTGKLLFGGEWLNYTEQMETAGLNNGIMTSPHKIDFVRTIWDTQACTSFSEIIITDPAHPYVLGTAVSARNGRLGGIDALITDKGDWLFSAANTLKYSKAEKWDVIPEAQRDTRETLIKAADAYLDSFNDKTVQVPWGSPCVRLEGGLYTGKGAPGEVRPDDTCNVGVPSNIKMAERRYIVDPSLGAVTVTLKMGPNQRPDAHSFRIEHGKIRYIHTITVCQDNNNCGFKIDPETQKRLDGN